LLPFLAAFFAFFAMVFVFLKFIYDEVIKNNDTKEIIDLVFFNTLLLITLKSDIIKSPFGSTFLFIFLFCHLKTTI